VGVSAACRTRQFTGFGSSTVSSLLECVQAKKKIKIINDGGLTVENGEVWIGDIAKAIALGSDFVMNGSLWSLCVDSPAIKDGYYGNASARNKNGNNHVEGTTVDVLTSGKDTLETIKLVEESLKSSVSYSGGNKLSDLKKCVYNEI